MIVGGVGSGEKKKGESNIQYKLYRMNRVIETAGERALHLL